MRASLPLALLAVTTALALAGCSSGGGDDDSSTTPPLTVGSGSSSAANGGGSSNTQASTSTAPPDYNVEMYDSRYDPVSLVVPNYQKVVFTNLGQLTHTVTIVRQGDSAGTTYRDQPVQYGATVDFNFPNDGTYTVYCRYHGTETSGMHMTITV